MPFGIRSANVVFQRCLDESLESLENIAVIHYDIVIFMFGDSIEEATTSHDLALRALLDRCRERGLKLTKKKICFKLSKIAYMGHILGADCLQDDPEKMMTLISAAWLDGKLQTPLCVLEYWPYKVDLSAQNNLVSRDTRIIIPHSLRTEMTARAHRSYF